MMARFERQDGLVGYRAPELVRLGVPHLFSTRRGPGGAELGLGELDQSTLASVASGAGAPKDALPCRVRQVHGSTVHCVTGAPPGRLRADALVTARCDRLLCILTADCVPILVAADGGARVAAIHAGWRGLVAGVIPRALAALGGPPAAAAIGPCLSLERFEVGPEVAAAFERAHLEPAVHRDCGPSPHVDLRAAAAIQLERAGFSRLDVSERCTWNDPELWSHRRDVTHGTRSSTGRLLALIAPRPR